MGGTLYYVHSDHLGSTVAVSDAAGGEVGRVQYDPYGEVLTSTLPTDLTDRLFTGARFDGTIGLYQMGARWYDPTLGRWIQADTIVPDYDNPQALNRYTYVYNNPLRYTDPSGHCIPGVNCPGDLPEPDWRPLTDPRSMSQEEYIAYLLWVGVHFEREEAETGGTRDLELSKIHLRSELYAALNKYMAREGEASWQAAIGGDPFIVYAIAQFGVQGGEDAYFALQQAYRNRAASTVGRLQQAAAQATAAVPGRGGRVGTLRHTVFKNIVKGWGGSSLRTEVSFRGRTEVDYGTAGSVRLDVVEYDASGRIIAVYDYKTGSATLTSSRIAQIRAHLPWYARGVPIIEIRGR